MYILHEFIKCESYKLCDFVMLIRLFEAIIVIQKIEINVGQLELLVSQRKPAKSIFWLAKLS